MSCVARLCFVCLLLTFLRFVLPYAALALGNPTPPALCQQPTLAVPAGPNGVVLAMVRARGNLYIGGSFTAVGGVAARNVARWDGHAWSSCGPGGLQPFATIYALAATADGQLYAAGQLADSVGARLRLLRWDGWCWRRLGRTQPDSVRYLHGPGTGGPADWRGVRGRAVCGKPAIAGDALLSPLEGAALGVPAGDWRAC